MTSEQDRRKWTQWLGWLVAIPACLWAASQFIDRWFISNEPEFLVSAATDSFALPPQLILAAPDGEEDDTKSVPIKVAPMTGVSGTVRMTIKNVGKLPAVNTRLRIEDNSGLAYIKWDDGRTEQQEFVTEISLRSQRNRRLSLWKVLL